MKSFFSLCFFIALIFAIILPFALKNPTTPSLNESLPTSSTDKKFQVAILLPISHPSLEEILEGFKNQLSSKASVTYTIYNGNGDRTLMRAQAEEVSRLEYDLVCTIATTPTLIFQEVCSQRNKNIPIVACAAEIEESLLSKNVTIVNDLHDFHQQVQVLKKLIPVQKIILIYNPTADLEKQKDMLEHICKTEGIQFTNTKIYDLKELARNTAPLLSSNPYEVIMVLKDNLVVTGIEALIKLAERYNKFLYASDLNSVDKGATAGFGVKEYDMGTQGGEKAIAILLEKKNPFELPSVFVNTFKLKANKNHLEQLSLLDNSTLLLMQTIMV